MITEASIILWAYISSIQFQPMIGGILLKKKILMDYSSIT